MRAHDVTNTDRAEFAQWLADAGNRREFDALLDLWERLGSLSRLERTR